MSVIPVFTYNIINMDVEKSCDCYFDIIKYIHLLIKASHENYKASCFYKLAIPLPTENFVPFQNITEQICNQWIASEELTNQEFINVRQGLIDEINQQISAPIISKLPPSFIT